MIRRVLSFIFECISVLRERLYRKGLFNTVRSKFRIISVGNISSGGSGKTPMAIWITQHMNDKGIKTALLEKGYKSPLGKNEVVTFDNVADARAERIGDEPAMAVKALKGKALVCVSKNKTAGVLRLEEDLGDTIKAVVVDDGFQHLRLQRDLDIVLMDAKEGFSGKVIPMGRLREPYGSLKRAQVLIFTKSEGIDPVELGKLKERALSINPALKIFIATTKLYSTEPLKDVKIFPLSSVSNYAFLHKKLRDEGAVFEKYLAYSDHYLFREDDISYIMKIFRGSSAELLVYTSKDAVKVRSMLEQEKIRACEVWYEHQIHNSEEFLKLCIG